MGNDVVKTRFAPTPSGWLHVGNALSFIITWLYARSSANGTIHLRIDDIDGERARDEFIEDIFRGIEWLGLDYDTGPTSDLQRRECLRRSGFPTTSRSPLASSIRAKDFPIRFVCNDRSPIHPVPV